MFMAITSETLKRALAVFLLGLICGIAGTVLFNLRLIDQFYLERESLLSELSEGRVRIAMLEQSLTERRDRIVRSVVIQLDAADQHLAVKLSSAARQLLDGLIGQEVSAIDPVLVAAIFQGRILSVEQQQFELNLNHLIISDTVTVNLRARQLDDSNTGN